MITAMILVRAEEWVLELFLPLSSSQVNHTLSLPPSLPPSLNPSCSLTIFGCEVHFSPLQLLPVNAFEEDVSLHILFSSLGVAPETTRRMLRQELCVCVCVGGGGGGGGNQAMKSIVHSTHLIIIEFSLKLTITFRVSSAVACESHVSAMKHIPQAVVQH